MKPAKWMKVAGANDLVPGQGKMVEVEGHTIALFNVDGTFYAMQGLCLHRGGPLGEGVTTCTIVTCPWHGWQYDITTGANVRNPDPKAKLMTYPTRIDGSDVLVEIPELCVETSRGAGGEGASISSMV